MSRFSGKQDHSGPKKGRRNKGVMAFYRSIQADKARERTEANQGTVMLCTATPECPFYMSTHGGSHKVAA